MDKKKIFIFLGIFFLVVLAGISYSYANGWRIVLESPDSKAPAYQAPPLYG